MKLHAISKNLPEVMSAWMICAKSRLSELIDQPWHDYEDLKQIDRLEAKLEQADVIQSTMIELTSGSWAVTFKDKALAKSCVRWYDA